MNSAHHSVQEAFDRHADIYDQRFSNQALGESIRSDVWRIADAAFAGASNLLDLGAGTGEDAIHFAQRRIQVTAVDISPRMMARLSAKAATAGVSSRIDCVVAEMSGYRSPAVRFDGLISNFSAINCSADLTLFREAARSALKPAATLVLTTMGRWYPLGTAVLLLKGRFGQAFHRLRKEIQVPIEGVSVDVFYHSPRSMQQAFGPDFRLERVVGLRAFQPVPGWQHLERYSVVPALSGLDKAWCNWRPTATSADHFVSVWRYRA